MSFFPRWDFGILAAAQVETHPILGWFSVPPAFSGAMIVDRRVHLWPWAMGHRLWVAGGPCCPGSPFYQLSTLAFIAPRRLLAASTGLFLFCWPWSPPVHFPIHSAPLVPLDDTSPVVKGQSPRPFPQLSQCRPRALQGFSAFVLGWGWLAQEVEPVGTVPLSPIPRTFFSKKI